MTDSPLLILDEWSPWVDEAAWNAALEASLTRDPEGWLRAVGPEPLVGMTKDQGWVLLGWVEQAASRVAPERSAALVELAAFCFALLEASPLDRRDVMVVAMLVRRAASAAGVDFVAASRRGCAGAGPHGERCREWLLLVSDALPPSHEEVGSGRRLVFRRRPTPPDDPFGALDGPAGG